jgi:hypothetical protein
MRWQEVSEIKSSLTKLAPIIQETQPDSALDEDWKPSTGALRGKQQNGDLPKAKQAPVTRKQVQQTRSQLDTVLRATGIEGRHTLPRDMDALLLIVKEEQKVYDAFFGEIVRQVFINMSERGEILAEIRKRYAVLFNKIPKHLQAIYEENIAQRMANARLMNELNQTKDTIVTLDRELTIIKRSDQVMSNNANSLATVLTKVSNDEQSISEYHKMYRLQRDRLEIQKNQLDSEKRTWMDAATVLSLRIAESNEVKELPRLLAIENTRMSVAEHIIHKINHQNLEAHRKVEILTEDWKTKSINLNQVIHEDTLDSLNIMQKLQKSIAAAIAQLKAGISSNDRDAELDCLQPFERYDVQTMIFKAREWVNSIMIVTGKFSSENDIIRLERLREIRIIADKWVEGGRILLRRNAETTNGRDFKTSIENLSRIAEKVAKWLNSLHLTITGDDGVATLTVNLENHMEDRCNLLAARDANSNLSLYERQELIEVLSDWDLSTRRIIGEFETYKPEIVLIMSRIHEH